MLTQKFGRAGLVIVGEGTQAIERQLARREVEAIVCPSAKELPALLPANGRKPVDVLAIWFYPKSESEDDAQVAEIARVADEILLVPGAGAEVAKRRPRLVERFRKFGFAPDYEFDLADLDSRRPSANPETSRKRRGFDSRRGVGRCPVESTDSAP